MKVLIIGAGNVATVLGRLIKAAGHDIVQVISRNVSSAKILADELNCPYTNDFITIDKTAGVYIVAMSDAALNGLHEEIKLQNQLIVHTAGAVSKDVLKNVSTQYGVLYPMQSMIKEEHYNPSQIPILIEGNTDATTITIEAFAKSIFPNVTVLKEEDRQKLHVAAVVVNNFPNYLYSLAHDFCEKEQVDFDLLFPLIDSLTKRLHYQHPANMQTGPAVRKDTATLDRHLRLLYNYPKLKSIYMKITDSIMN